MAMVAGRMIPNKHIVIALTYIYGVGRSTAMKLCSQVELDPSKKVQDLLESELQALREALSAYTLEGDLRRVESLAIKELVDKGCYRGIRHRRGLTVRGQRTKTNAKTAKKRKLRK